MCEIRQPPKLAGGRQRGKRTQARRALHGEDCGFGAEIANRGGRANGRPQLRERITSAVEDIEGLGIETPDRQIAEYSSVSVDAQRITDTSRRQIVDPAGRQSPD